jgi:hypothetical protein
LNDSGERQYNRFRKASSNFSNLPGHGNKEREHEKDLWLFDRRHGWRTGLAPESGEQLRGELRSRGETFFSEVRHAADERRIELRQRLESMREPRLEE